MPLSEDFVVVQIRKETRRKLKFLAMLQEKPMYQVFEEVLEGLLPEDNVGLRRVIREEIHRAREEVIL